jgi:hypothetical protein
MDGSVDPVVVFFDQDETVTGFPTAPEGEAAQLGCEGIAPFGLFDQGSATFLMDDFSIISH